jgi:transposase InsO family protein
MLTWFRNNIYKYNFYMEQIYEVAGISRQGYHKQALRQEEKALMYSRIKELVQELREDHPRIGARKLFVMLKLEGEIGVNKFEQFLSGEGLGIKVKRSAQKTTNSTHPLYKYTNLLNGLKLTSVNQVWVSDITYFMIGENVYYITFIQDVYSRRILGYSVSDNMLHQNNLKVLQDSIALRKGKDLSKLIHHSDKGSQYCSTNYINILKGEKMSISMAGTSIENPYVERLNGIIKNDYLYPRKKVHDLKSLKREMNIVVELYNGNRPHSQLGNLTPLQFEKQQEGILDGQPIVMELYNYEQNYYDRFFEAWAKRMKDEKLPTQESLVGNIHSHRTSYS